MKKTDSPIAVSRNLAHGGLLFFLAILLIQSVIGLFIPATAGMENIDVVLRTTLSSIFGYLMTSIWQNANRVVPAKPTQPRTIGFSGDNTPPRASLPQEQPAPAHTVAPPPTAPPPQSIARTPTQVYALICAGLFCLLALIGLRFFGQYVALSNGAIATIAQYRDIVSGSVGALIGLVRGKDTPLQTP